MYKRSISCALILFTTMFDLIQKLGKSAKSKLLLRGQEQEHLISEIAIKVEKQ